MNFFLKFIVIIFIVTLFASCSKKEKVTVLKQQDLGEQMTELYKEAYKEFIDGDSLYAAEKFNEAELIFPQSEWAPIAALMSAYVYYSDDYYSDAVYQLERYLKVYPKHKDQDYAHFLLAMCYYENIIDEKRDLNPLLKSKKEFEFILKEYPSTDFAADAQFKIDLINDRLAGKEMYIARHYLKSQKWIPAINRFKNILENYETTVYVEEALHRLVETYYIIGLENESKKYANLLGYNYQSSEWYEKSYSMFNKMYNKKKKERIKKEKQKKSGFFKKIKPLFN